MSESALRESQINHSLSYSLSTPTKLGNFLDRGHISLPYQAPPLGALNEFPISAL